MDKKKITIVTHSSGFHTDDVFAVATLLLVLGENKNIEVLRSREKEVIERGDYVVDVGGIYDPENNRFDHHQEGGAGARDNTVPYASFGLVWKKYGRELCGDIEVAQTIDQEIVQPVDAIDVGVDFIETKIPNLYLYDIGEFFDSFMPSWKNEKANIDEIFTQTVKTATELLKREISLNKDKLEANSIVEEIYKASSDKRLIIFDRYYPTGEVLSKHPETLFTVSPRDDGKWDLLCVRNDPKSFVNRKNLPKEWAGKRDSELENITGVEGATFCHNARFIAVAKTKEAILQLAEIALNS